jgi:hypothetical protein
MKRKSRDLSLQTLSWVGMILSLALTLKQEVKDMAKQRKVLIVTLILLLLSFAPCKSQEVTSNILQRVFLIKYGGKLGSSFTIDVQNRQYLITARHLVNGIKKGNTIEVFHNNQWEPVKVIPLYTDPSEVDIVVLVLPMQISPSHPLEASCANYSLSENTYFLGFPYGYNMDYRQLNNGYPLPFVKQGIVSAFDSLPNKYQVVFVDGMGNPGFSGGPILRVSNRVTKQLTVMAVVSHLIPHGPQEEDKVLRKVKKAGGEPSKEKGSGDEFKFVETDMIVKGNPGLVVGYCIDSALDAISKNPIGPLISW